jgi:hypothetical protein
VPAVADRTTDVSLNAGTRITKGDAHFDDKCPGDGYAAYVAFAISVNEDEFQIVNYYKTKGLCKAGRMPIELGMTGGGGKNKITGVKVIVFESDADRTTGSGWGDHFEALYFNPGPK